MKIGDSVKVKIGVLDSEFEKYKIFGWQGRIIEIYDLDELQLEIELDSITLKQLPKEYIWESLNNGSDYALLEILHSDVQLVEPRDTIDEVKAVRQEMNKELDYVSVLDEGEDENKRFIAAFNALQSVIDPRISYSEIKYPSLN
ncbi:MAG: hypothetical protein HY951_14285 [Bacteroidia bacterium]|nr:hypothetical protein [Bacteroidia bacterium]